MKLIYVYFNFCIFHWWYNAIIKVDIQISKKLAYFLGIHKEIFYFFFSRYFYNFLYIWFHNTIKTNLLINGPKGTGKTSLVYLWAGYMNLFLFEIVFLKKKIFKIDEIVNFILFHINKLKVSEKSIIFFDNINAIEFDKIEYIIKKTLLNLSNSCNYCFKYDKNIIEGRYPIIIGCCSSTTFFDLSFSFLKNFIFLSISSLNFKQKLLFFINVSKKLVISKKCLIKLVYKITNTCYINDIIHIFEKAINISIKRLIYGFFKESSLKKSSELHMFITLEDLKLSLYYSKMFNKINSKKQYIPELYSFSYVDKIAFETTGKIIKNSNNLYMKQYNTKSFKNNVPVLLVGPPGCGKTFIGKKIAMELNLFYLYVKTPQILNKYVGEAEKYLNKIFLKATTNNPSLLFFDEIEAIALSRSLNDENNNKITQQLLLELDDLNFKINVFVIGATNLIEIIDLAILRKGRFGKKFLISFPSNKNKLNVIRNQTSNTFLSNCFDLKLIIINFFFTYNSSADIKELLNQITNSKTIIYNKFCILKYKSKKFFIKKNKTKSIILPDWIKLF
uniref:CDC48-like protein n=1 Tax=Lotharella vacuolata TaxID=74820 RepID=A0A0H5BQW2_9EUKA|nr:CDC48-like protein [Lotharella vacuolata]